VSVRVAVDIGGTFTDATLIAEAPLAVPTSGRAATPGVRLRRQPDTDDAIMR
jgi:N-methylhydantoinase A/oxoprolinase/acetone carboxylase beta subunit